MKRVILVRPSGPRNVGMVLRITQNFGPCELWLVAPERPSMLVHPEFVQMAHGAADQRERVVVVSELEPALADCTWSVGFTARVRGNRIRNDWRDVHERLATRAEQEGERLALVFGNEMTGMTVAEASRLAEIAHIRTAREHTSLNLAVSVGIVLSNLYTGTTVHQPEPGGSAVSGEAREFLKQRMQEVFAGRVARSASASRDIHTSIERVFSRAPLETRDARAWHLMLRALGSTTTPGDLGLDPTPPRKRETTESDAETDECEPPRSGAP
jgi:tRNA/rRNA methyltransferase